MKKWALFFIMTLLLFGTACSNKENVSPNDFFDDYVSEWNALNFTEMYNMLSNEASKAYAPEDFVDRYIKIYDDLDITNLKVTYEEIDDEAIKQAFETAEANLPLKVEMDSLAGPISFNYEAQLTREEIENDSNQTKSYEWAVDWNPGFIFPPLKDGGKINIQATKPKRGEILDRNQMPLAINDTVFEIGIIPEKMENNEDAIKKQVSDLLNISVASIEDALNASWVEPHLFVPLKKVSPTKEDVLNQLWAIDSVLGNEVDGRSYPLGKAASHLVGYVGQVTAEELEKQENGVYDETDIIGKRGLEQIYETQLKGKKGTRIVVSSEDEEDVILAEIPVEDGENISVTIDANFQEEIYNSYDGKSGTAAAIDPRTGETLALVSSPAFDPHDLLYGISASDWEKLQNDPQEPFLNRFSATFAPGSVIKPLTAAIGLENGSIKADQGVEITGHTWSNGEGWGGYKVRRVSVSSKPVDLADALIRSDNIYFAMKAVDMGSDAFIKGMKNFGFEEDIPFEYPIRKSTISTSGKLEGEVELANSSYGQAQLETSALHLALTYGAFLNEGNLFKPTLLMSTDTKQMWHENIVSPEDAQLIQDILRDVVADGTAKVANRDEFEISGKTGTAELKQASGERGQENGWFIGYPTKDQDIVISMLVEHAEDIGTSSYAANKVADLLVKLKLELSLEDD